MGRSPCRRDEAALKKGPWTPEEDKILVDYIEKHGLGSWSALPGKAGLNRCGKSCRLRWTNYLRPDIKRGRFSEEEERLIIQLHSHIGNKWSTMAARLPGRTDNEIKNYWNTHLKKKLLRHGVDPVTHRPHGGVDDLALLANMLGVPSLGFSGSASAWDSNNGSPGRTQQLADSVQLARLQLLQTMVRVIVASAPSNSDLARVMSSTLRRNGGPSADSLFHGPKFQGLLDGTLGALVQAAVPGAGVGLSSFAAGCIPPDFNVFGRPCASIDGEGLLSPTYMSSTPEASTVDNNYGVGYDHQVLNSDNTPTAASTSPSVASAPPEHAAVDDHHQETMNSGLVSQDQQYLSTAELNPWSDYLAEAINDVPDWWDFLD